MTAELAATPFPHGTPAGADMGCKLSWCPNVGSATLMSCADAALRYRWDLAYRRAVDAGTATTEREVINKHTAPVRKIKSLRPRKSRAKSGIKPEREHGTAAGYKVCTKDETCPSFLAGGQSCRQARNEQSRRRRAANASPPVDKEFPHGTVRGYKRGCRLGKDCPGNDEGVTCVVAVRLKNTPEKRGQNILPHGTAASYRRGCRNPATCPSFFEGGLSCSQAERDYRRGLKAGVK